MKLGEIGAVLEDVDLGSSVAEFDTLLESARVETSVFADLWSDRVDLVPGTKGSGKSALYRIFVDFLGPALLERRKVVVAHGVESHGDSVFMAFSDDFDALGEDQFIDFWCIYLTSLAHEQFVKNPMFLELLRDAGPEVDAFRAACAKARIPEISARKSLRDILEWTISAIPRPRRVTLTTPEGATLGLEVEAPSAPAHVAREGPQLPMYIGDVRRTLEAILNKADVSLWLMVDRLDEVFLRRSPTETRALRGLLRTLRMFTSERIRVKVFLRDDILEQVTEGAEGFTALTHVTARQADTLEWSEDAILTLIVNRLFASNALREFLGIDPEQLAASRDYRQDAFYRVFPRTVHTGLNQSATLRWIYSHTMDGRGVVTPRDVIDLLTRAKQRQQDECGANPIDEAEILIGSAAILHGLSELSRRKRDTLLKAELPHLWPYIEKLVGQKTEYSGRALRLMFGTGSERIVEDLVKIGLFQRQRRSAGDTYKVPFLFRDGLELTQGTIE